jgi:hypothetical protein
MPIEMEFFGHLLDGGFSTASPDEIGEAFRIEGIVGKPIQLLVFHTATLGALHSTQEKEQINSLVATRKIADVPRPLVVMLEIAATADAANRFFPGAVGR